MYSWRNGHRTMRTPCILSERKVGERHTNFLMHCNNYVYKVRFVKRSHFYYRIYKARFTCQLNLSTKYQTNRLCTYVQHSRRRAKFDWQKWVKWWRKFVLHTFWLAAWIAEAELPTSMKLSTNHKRQFYQLIQRIADISDSCL